MKTYRWQCFDLVCKLAIAFAVLPAFESTANFAQTPQTQAPLPGAGLVNPRPPFLAAIKVNHADHAYADGDHLSLTFAAEQESFLYLLYHQADGRTILLFPNSAETRNGVPAHQGVKIPPPNQAFGMHIRAPFGTEVVQVLASHGRLAELDALLAAPATRPLVSPQVLERLARALRSGQVAWAEHHVPIRTVAAKESRQTRQRVGLFIGVGKYDHPEIAEEHEELRHSAEVIHEAMLAHGKLDPKLTRLVTDKAATRAQLEDLFLHWLPQISQPGDKVFIYYSGHAGIFQSARGAWKEGAVMLGPVDLDPGPADATQEVFEARVRETGISSETLGRWLEELADRRVVLILDTCHSGAVLQSKRVAGLFANKTKQLKELGQMNLVVLTSCARDEQSLFHGTPNKTMWFTYFLSESLEKLPAPLTIDAAHRYALDGMKRVVEQMRESSQEPQLSDSALLPVYLVP